MSLTQHLKFDDNAATTTVVATTGSNGTLNGGDNTSVVHSTSTPGGSITASFLLNGTDDFVAHSGQLAAGAAGSLSIWFKCASTPSDYTLFGHSGSSTNQFVRIVTNTTIAVRPSTAASTFTVPALGTTWHHLLVTKTTGDSYRLFLDGTESSTGALSNANVWNTITPRIGVRSSATGFFSGNLAWAKVFDSDESANVATLYAEGVSSGSVFSPYYYREHIARAW